MPKSFLIRKKGLHLPAPSSSNEDPNAWNTTGTTPLQADKASALSDVEPCSALNDDDEIVEPLDLIVSRVGKDDVEILEDIKEPQRQWNIGRAPLVNHYPQGMASNHLINHPPYQTSANHDESTASLNTNRYPVPITGPSERHRRRHSKEPGSPLPPMTDEPGIGYFSRCLLAFKLKGSRDQDGIKRYYCMYCSKGFNDKFDLKRHTRTHTGVRPYKCDRCFRAFTQRCSLEVHQRKVHNMELNFAFKQRRGKVYVCEDCGHSTDDIHRHYAHSAREHRMGTSWRNVPREAPQCSLPRPTFNLPVAPLSGVNFKQNHQGNMAVMPGLFN